MLQNASDLWGNRLARAGLIEAFTKLATKILGPVPVGISGRGLPLAKLGVSRVRRSRRLDLVPRSAGWPLSQDVFGKESLEGFQHVSGPT